MQETQEKSSGAARGDFHLKAKRPLICLSLRAMAELSQFKSVLHYELTNGGSSAFNRSATRWPCGLCDTQALHGQVKSGRHQGRFSQAQAPQKNTQEWISENRKWLNIFYF